MMLMAETTANPRFLRAISAPGADVGHTITFEAPVALDAGRSLAPVTVAYMTYGTLNPTKSNVVLVCHALTGDQFAASASPITGKPGWWDVMVGPGKPIDTDRYFVVCSNILGGCMGSTGPAEIDPTTGKPFGLTFPLVTVRDMVRAQAMLLDALGIDKILCVIGGSLGGMQVLQWAASYPERVISAVPIATAARHSAQNIAFHEVGRQAIMADPDWKGGAYQLSAAQPSKGLAVARMAAHITYLSETALQRKFGRNLQNRQSVSFEFRPDFQIESYLHHQGMTFVDRFDANSYLYITRAMDYFDLAADYDGVLANAFRGSKTRFCIISFTSDWLFPTAENKLVAHALNAAAANVSFVEIETDRGHDAFLLDEPEMFAAVRGFLSSVAHAHGLT
jgi:homoserine O-acetyltransferase